MAPPPPPAEKRTRLMTPAEAADPETVSLLMMFDDLVRNQKVILFICPNIKIKPKYAKRIICN